MDDEHTDTDAHSTDGPCANSPTFLTPTWWWLSFADATRPESDHLLGVAIVRAPAVDRAGMDRFCLLRHQAGHPRPFTAPADAKDVSHTLAVVRSHQLGINPGGSVAGWVLTDDELPPAGLRERLLSKDDLIEAGLYVGNIADNGGWENYL